MSIYSHKSAAPAISDDPEVPFPATPHHEGNGHGGHNGHDPHLAHHFDTPQQQFSAGKLGMWVFLGTELLMFGGLFCAYAVYRHNHPEVFAYAAHHLNTWLGATNTVVLIASSFTMAWGVRCAQTNDKSGLVICLALTLLGGFGFMGIKSYEYYTKYEHGLFPGQMNLYDQRYAGPLKPGQHEGGETAEGETHDEGSVPQPGVDVNAEPSQGAGLPGGVTGDQQAAAAQPAAANSGGNVTLEEVNPIYFDPNAGTADAAKIRPSFTNVDGLAKTAGPKQLTFEDLPPADAAHVAMFFNIYFFMTGLHGVHVLVGMGLISWILIRAMGGAFSDAYFTPVDLVGLYWHLVDLIWIFLFPLLYLIHS